MECVLVSIVVCAAFFGLVGQRAWARGRIQLKKQWYDPRITKKQECDLVLFFGHDSNGGNTIGLKKAAGLRPFLFFPFFALFVAHTQVERACEQNAGVGNGNI